MYVDGEFLFSIKNDKTILEFRLTKDFQLTNDLIKEILTFDLKMYVFEEMLSLVMRRPRSIYEIQKKIKEKVRKRLEKNTKIKLNTEITESLSKEIVESLIEKNYVNDEEFATWWIESRVKSKVKSKLQIKSELAAKGISSEVINNLMQDVDTDYEEEIAFNLAEKKYISLKSKKSEKIKEKIIFHLSQKGFNWEIINKALTRLNIN